LKRYIAEGALIYRYQNSTKLNINGSPYTDPTTQVTSSSWEFEDETEVTWFYELEPAPVGTSTSGFFSFVSFLPGEDIAGGGLGGEGSGAANRRIINQPGHGFATGDVLRIDSVSDEYELAQADTDVRSEVVGIITNIVDADNFELTTDGYFDLTASAAPYLPLMPGYVYFSSLTTAGSLQSTQPSIEGQISKPVLIAETTTTGYVQNLRGVIIVDPTGSDDKVVSGGVEVDDTETGVVDQVDISLYRTSKWIVSVTDNFNGTYLSAEVLAHHDGVGTTHSIYSITGSASVVFDVIVSGGFMQLIVTGTNDDQVIKSERIAVSA
jgi:hypothetical protein